jgi:enoyl-CoA hydratase/carnithine racemase
MGVGMNLVSLQPADLRAPLPAWETGISAGALGVALIDGSGGEWSALAGRPGRASEELQQAPVITVGVVRDEDQLTPAGAELARACDLVLDQPDFDHRVADVLELIQATGPPALLAAQLMRPGPNALATESLTYSVLLFSEQFREWREHHPPVAPSRDEAPRVELSRSEGLWTIALNRPARHNAFDARMREELCDALDVIASEPPAPVVLLGHGPSFCSGGDLDEFGTASSPVSAHLVRGGRSVARRLQRLQLALVAAVHGHCIGAGVEFAAFAGRVVAEATATFALPEMELGLNLGAGGSVSVPRRIGRQRTLEALMRGAPIDAPTALDWGLVDELVEPGHVVQRAIEVAEALA